LVAINPKAILVARRKYGSELLAIHAERIGAVAYMPGMVKYREPYATNSSLVPVHKKRRIRRSQSAHHHMDRNKFEEAFGRRRA